MPGALSHTKQHPQQVSFWVFILFCFFGRVSLCSSGSLELPLQLRLAFKLQRFSCLSFLSVRITGVRHHAQPENKNVLKILKLHYVLLLCVSKMEHQYSWGTLAHVPAEPLHVCCSVYAVGSPLLTCVILCLVNTMPVYLLRHVFHRMTELCLNVLTIIFLVFLIIDFFLRYFFIQ